MVEEEFPGGGVASREEYAFDLIDPNAMMAMARVMYEGIEIGREKDNWRKLPVEVHLNHLLIHVFKHMRGDRDEDHLARVMCRAFMAWSGANASEYIRPEVTSLLNPDRGDTASGKEDKMEIIYVCAPLNGNHLPIRENVRRVVEAIQKLKCEWGQRGKMPLVLCPHTMFQGISFDFDGEDRKWGMEMCIEAVKLCDTMIVLGEGNTSGMRQEIEEAQRLNKKIERRADL